MRRAYEDTKSPVERTRTQIEKLLRDRQVTDIRLTTTASLAAVEFNWSLMGDCAEPRVKRYQWDNAPSWCEKHKRDGKHEALRSLLGVRMVAPWSADQKEQRRIMRVLFWHLKSKLETVEAGILTFAEEFLPHLTLGRGRRVWDELGPMIDAAIAEGHDLRTDMEAITAKGAKRLALPKPDHIEGEIVR